MPALVGPEAASTPSISTTSSNCRRPSGPPSSPPKREEYNADIDVFSAAADPMAVEAVVHPNKLRDELIQRFRAYSLKKAIPFEKRNAVHPV